MPFLVVCPVRSLVSYQLLRYYHELLVTLGCQMVRHLGYGSEVLFVRRDQSDSARVVLQPWWRMPVAKKRKNQWTSVVLVLCPGSSF